MLVRVRWLSSMLNSVNFCYNNSCVTKELTGEFFLTACIFYPLLPVSHLRALCTKGTAYARCLPVTIGTYLLNHQWLFTRGNIICTLKMHNTFLVFDLVMKTMAIGVGQPKPFTCGIWFCIRLVYSDFYKAR